jgi:hypothetical protein
MANYAFFPQTLAKPVAPTPRTFMANYAFFPQTLAKPGTHATDFHGKLRFFPPERRSPFAAQKLQRTTFEAFIV